MELPQTAYVKVEHEREPAEDYLVVSGCMGDISEPESTIEIGVYELRQMVKLVNESYIRQERK